MMKAGPEKQPTMNASAAQSPAQVVRGSTAPYLHGRVSLSSSLRPCAQL
jgi:hypothetical protein